MPDTTKTLDGKFSLDELKQTLVTQEQLGFKRLAGLTARPTPPPTNVATFKDDPDPNPPATLVLEQIGPGQNLNAIIADQKTKGHDFLFSSTVFVNGISAPIAVFR
jgi:hypothetical protein